MRHAFSAFFFLVFSLSLASSASAQCERQQVAIERCAERANAAYERACAAAERRSENCADSCQVRARTCYRAARGRDNASERCGEAREACENRCPSSQPERSENECARERRPYDACMAPILAERARVAMERRVAQQAAQRAAQAEQARVEAERQVEQARVEAERQVEQARVEAARQAARTAGFYRDPASGLVMQFGFSPIEQNRAGSRAYCSHILLAGGGWRLPTKDELLDVYTNSRYLEPSDAGFWSTTPVAGSPFDGWGVYFIDGSAYSSAATLIGRARCVR